RPSGPGSPAEPLAALGGGSSASVGRPAPLTEAGTEAIVRSRLAEEPVDGLVAACHRASGGNPQLIRELLAALAAEGVEPTPAGAAQMADVRAGRIAASVLARLGRLGEPAVALARSVAVLGRDADPGLAGELAGLTPA